jgi:hypothetical protein
VFNISAAQTWISHASVVALATAPVGLSWAATLAGVSEDNITNFANLIVIPRFGGATLCWMSREFNRLEAIDATAGALAYCASSS